MPARVQDIALVYPYRWIVAVVSTVTMLLWLAQQHISQANIALCYLLAVLLCAITARRLPALVGAVFCFLAFKFFFVEPIFGFTVNDIVKPWELLSFIAAALIAGAMTLHAREQAAIVRQQAREIATLAASRSAQPVELTDFADGEFAIFLDDADADLLLRLFEERRLVARQDPSWELHDVLSEFVSHWLSVQARAG
jgi:two-component system sensor histidine kinase KdpD